MRDHFCYPLPRIRAEQPEQGFMRAQIEHVGNDPFAVPLHVDAVRVEGPECGLYG